MKWYYAPFTLVLMALAISQSYGEVVMVATETDGNVVLTGSGTFNLTALSMDFLAGNQQGIGTGISGAIPDVRVGPAHDVFSGPNFDSYLGDSLSIPDGFEPPPSFPSADVVLGRRPGFYSADSGSGDLFGAAYIYFNAGETIEPLLPVIIVPAFYISGTELSGTAIFSGQTFDSLGVTPGSYVWTWGSGASRDSLTLNIIAPEPSTLFLACTAFAPLFSRRRTRYSVAG